MAAAFTMTAFLSWVLTRAVRARTRIDATVTFLLLVVMVAMLLGPVYLYLTTFGLIIGDVAIWAFNLASGSIVLTRRASVISILEEVDYTLITYRFIFAMAHDMTLAGGLLWWFV